MIETVRDWMGRHRRIVLAGLFVIAAIVCGLLMARRDAYRGKYAVPSAGSDAAALAPSTPPAAPPPAVPVTVHRPLPAPAPMVAPDAAAPDDDDADERDDRDRIAQAIDHAVRKALRRGEPVRWHKAGESGYIVVSEPRDYADRTCRNVSATVTREDGETQSNAHLWCTPADDEDWAPE